MLLGNYTKPSLFTTGLVLGIVGHIWETPACRISPQPGPRQALRAVVEKEAAVIEFEILPHTGPATEQDKAPEFMYPFVNDSDSFAYKAPLLIV